MKFTVAQIAGLLQAEIEGDPSLEINDLCSIESGKPGSLAFLANPQYTPYIYKTAASAVIVARDFTPSEPISATLLRVNDPRSAYSAVLEQVANFMNPPKSGIAAGSFVHESAKVGEDVFLGHGAYIGADAHVADGAQVYPGVFVGEGVKIGAKTVIYPNVTLYPRVEIGSNCIIHAGAAIGSDGFGFVPKEDGEYQKMPQIGTVVIEDDVEIGANCTIDRAAVGATIIGRGAKLDNLIHLAHAVNIGHHTAIAAQAGIAGSTQVGPYCQFGGQVGIVGHLEIAPHTKIDAQSGVNKSIKKPDQAFRGSPIQPYRQQLKSEVVFRKLDKLVERINHLEALLAEKD
ncbi:MAG: UDP-3-O-(3-hydroxymyristoyl)glucosamine N-acyltransferase [Bacteroidota bacterium]